MTIDTVAVSAFPTDKIRALLTYLALESRAEIEQPHRREKLAGLLWPDMPDAAALTNLRLALHRLRHTLDQAVPNTADRLFTITRQTIQLNHTSLIVDARTFQALLATCAAHTHLHLHSCEACVARLTDAVDLYRGELLAGFGLADAPEFEEWLLLRREMLHQQALAALHSLVGVYEQRGDEYRAHMYASRQIALDPYREEAHRQLMRILARRSLYSEALAQFETCRRLLYEGLGVEPDTETLALADALRSEQTNSAVSHTPFAPSTNTTPIARRTTLPAPLTPLTGREHELAHMTDLLRGDTTRLITIIGVGGVGKTRLALAAAWESHEAFADGAVWVPLASLAPVADPVLQTNALATAVGSAFGMNFEGRSAPFDTLCSNLENQARLLIFDNCEHLNATLFVRALLVASPHLRILATSRTRLNVAGELLVRLEGLPVPEQAVDDPMQYASVQLFLSHAQRHAPDFGGTPQQLAAAVRLCQLLEGLPLGIELAARWVEHYTCDEIANEIRIDIDFLAVQHGDVADRHRSLRAVFDYSWAMLRDTERQALAQLAIFRSSFDRAAAQAITGIRATTLAALVDASLLRHLGVGHYGFHELVHQFAAAQLAASEEAALAHNHAVYYMNLLAQQEPALYGSAPHTGAVTIRDVADHVQQAWTWSVEQSAWELVARSLPALRQYIRITGLFHEGTLRIAAAIAQLDREFAQGTPAPAYTALLGRLHSTLAYFLERQELRAEAGNAAHTAVDCAAAADDVVGEAYAYLRLSCATLAYVAALSPLETEPVSAWLEHAISLCRTAQPAEPLERRYVIESEAECLLYLSTILIKRGQYPEACVLPEQALALARANGDCMQETRALNFFAETLENAGRYEQAHTQRVVMLTLARLNGSTLEEYVALNNLSCTLIQLGDYPSALEHAYAGLRVLLTQTHSPYDLANAYHTVSWAACRAGETAIALDAARQALTLVQATRVPQYQTLPLLAVGDALYDGGQYAEARDAYTTALELGQTQQMPPVVTAALAGIARCWLAQGALAEAQTAVNTILRDQDILGLGSIWEPLRIAATCYHVLDASGDSRAAGVLQDAIVRLNKQANAISDQERRRVFREQVRAHQTIFEASVVSASKYALT